MSEEEIEGLELGTIPLPVALDGGSGPGRTPARLTPEQRISLYDADEWEEFIRECVTVLEPEYVQIARIGGTGDHGLDVVGFLDTSRLEGEWDCFQCKHYNRELRVGDALTEIAKVVRGVIQHVYAWPRRYRFVAPRGAGTRLKLLLNAPDQLKAEFVERLTADESPLARMFEGIPLEWVGAYLASADFAIFGELDPHDAVELHSRTRWHAVRFEEPLPVRPPVGQPPDVPDSSEHRYIEQLIAVYNERYGGDAITAENVGDHTHAGKHYPRQREAFFSAEALRAFARDSVPEGTFESLKEEVYDGVVETEAGSYADGFERLTSVLEASVGIQITSNVLMPRTTVTDRKGLCHHLANEDRLTWCRDDHAATE